MSSATEPRHDLASRQAALVEAIMTGAAAPAGFDNERLRMASVALFRKRLRTVAQAWPMLGRELGERFRDCFSDYSRQHPIPRFGGPLADGRAFVRWLAARQAISDETRAAALWIDVQYKSTRTGLIPRRGPALRLALSRRPWRLTVAVRCPGIATRIWQLSRRSHGLSS
jgi:hypothetical protein